MAAQGVRIPHIPARMIALFKFKPLAHFPSQTPRGSNNAAQTRDPAVGVSLSCTLKVALYQHKSEIVIKDID